MKLAQKAAAAINKFYIAEIIVEEKIGADSFAEPVTAADREASRIIVAGLSAAFPRDAILSEEEPDDIENRLSNDRVWIIDPIDGTAGFIKQDGDFAVQIGFTFRGEPVVGVVLLPARDILYTAVKGGGAFRTEAGGPPVKLKTTHVAEFSEVTMAISRNHPSSALRKVIAQMGILRCIDRGSVGLKVGLIAEGSCDLYIHLSGRTKFWDTCGPQVIIEEAGGRMTDLFGEPMRYDTADLRNHNGILTSNGVLHERSVAALRDILASA